MTTATSRSEHNTVAIRPMNRRMVYAVGLWLFGWYFISSFSFGAKIYGGIIVWDSFFGLVLAALCLIPLPQTTEKAFERNLILIVPVFLILVTVGSLLYSVHLTLTDQNTLAAVYDYGALKSASIAAALMTGLLLTYLSHRPSAWDVVRIWGWTIAVFGLQFIFIIVFGVLSSARV